MPKYDQIINSWKEEIESISINGFNRKIESVDFFPMKSKHHPDSEAWKVNFNFMDGIRHIDGSGMLMDIYLYKTKKAKTFINCLGFPNYYYFI
jgi:hypothetical protein